MKNLYLKEIEFNDLNLLIDYNNDFKKYFPNFKNSINENTFNDWLKEIKESQKDESKMHVYPYWLMKGEKAIGLPILKTNIDANEEYKKYGGHISYVISPSYRMKGYGTHCLHLALKECEKLGLDTVLITCDEKNVGSARVIENNYGHLIDTCMCDMGSYKGRIFRRYSININKSLDFYNQNISKKKY